MTGARATCKTCGRRGEYRPASIMDTGDEEGYWAHLQPTDHQFVPARPVDRMGCDLVEAKWEGDSAQQHHEWLHERVDRLEDLLSRVAIEYKDQVHFIDEILRVLAHEPDPPVQAHKVRIPKGRLRVL